EGWHTGEEWITSGSLVDRVNFAAQRLGDASNPGVKNLVSRVNDSSDSSDPSDLVDACLEVMGPMDVSDETRTLLVDMAARGIEAEPSGSASQELILSVFKLIVSSREYQLC
ncbi:MAG: DUF1800 family protein, partial [Dehalococcoidia bacterium]|nr:DUF1800 family protein [Dehalococcoidia bacterium]